MSHCPIFINCLIWTLSGMFVSVYKRLMFAGSDYRTAVLCKNDLLFFFTLLPSFTFTILPALLSLGFFLTPSIMTL